MNLNAYSFYTNEFKPVTVFIQMCAKLTQATSRCCTIVQEFDSAML